MQNKDLYGYVSKNKELPPWEVDLELVNFQKNNGKWKNPKQLKKKDYLFLYFVCLRTILKETFNITIPMKDDDYVSLEEWENVYEENNLSQDSLDYDVKDKLKELK